ncbi:MAG TPA: GerMN domain-containing protein [Candidatus Dormibacteraeota bacterium]|nr:GerMN domain-containing protein [Candidatus Dormibacteraeota bacterium]
MSARWIRLVLGGLFGAVIIAGLYFPILKQRVKQTAKIQPQSEEQARRELTQSLTANPTEARVKAKLFWAANAHDGSLAPVTIDLPLSSDPALRAKQVLNTLLAGPADPELRTVPPDAVLLAFYLLPDGTGIADFSEAMASSIPSGIESEQRAVDSITHTLAANVPQVTRLKILIHGQEVETLAGHLDLTGSFAVNPRAAQAAAAPQPDPLTSSSSPAPPLTPESGSRQTYAATREQPTNSRKP